MIINKFCKLILFAHTLIYKLNDIIKIDYSSCIIILPYLQKPKRICVFTLSIYYLVESANYLFIEFDKNFYFLKVILRFAIKKNFKNLSFVAKLLDFSMPFDVLVV